MKERDVGELSIVAIGGGGFTHGTYPSLDAFCITRSGKDDPAVGFIGTASRDDPVKIDRFHACFSTHVTRHEYLPMDLDAEALARRLAGLDMVYVGGGDTEAMVAEWHGSGWDDVLRDAALSGLTLAGVSAGAVCWFEWFLFSSGTGPMRPLRGLGLLRGGACPHYSTEPDRQVALHKAVADRSMPASLAMDDGVAVAFGAKGPEAVLSAAPDAGAYEITRRSDGTAHQVPLRVSGLSRSA